MTLNSYGEQLVQIIQDHGVSRQIATDIALYLQSQGWGPYSSVASSPTAQQANFSESA